MIFVNQFMRNSNNKIIITHFYHFVNLDFGLDTRKNLIDVPARSGYNGFGLGRDTSKTYG